MNFCVFIKNTKKSESRANENIKLHCSIFLSGWHVGFACQPLSDDVENSGSDL
jgi:hypothetical protein